MGDLSEHFSRSEFACKCGCGFDFVDAELIRVLENLRAKLGNRKIEITSGCRCPHHNALEGGARNSKHLLGIAADIKVAGWPPSAVAECLEDLYPGQYGLGRYLKKTITHIDVRKTTARWLK